MKKPILYILFLLGFINFIQGQVIYKSFESSKLGTSRELKIQLPRGYINDKDKTYPLFIVLDGDYLFEAAAGNVDYYTYWEDMPNAIVVGVNQFDFRDDDCMY